MATPIVSTRQCNPEPVVQRFTGSQDSSEQNPRGARGRDASRGGLPLLAQPECCYQRAFLMNETRFRAIQLPLLKLTSLRKSVLSDVPQIHLSYAQKCCPLRGPGLLARWAGAPPSLVRVWVPSERIQGPT